MIFRVKGNVPGQHLYYILRISNMAVRTMNISKQLPI